MIAWSVAFSRCIFAITASILNVKAQTLTNFATLYGWLVTLMFASDAVVDLLNTCSICWCLVRRRSGLKS
jgi:hypothetical protein